MASALNSNGEDNPPIVNVVKSAKTVLEEGINKTV
jgi:hypothetical protein